MGGIFNIDSPIMNILNKVTNIVILNLCFIVSCLPVVTIGAGITALYTVNLKMVRDEESYVFSAYWNAFRKNFKQSTLCWLILLAVGVIFFLDFRVAFSLSGAAGLFFRVVLSVLGVIYIVTLLYIFPYIARFDDNIKTCFKNALMIGGANIGYTFVILMIMAACTAVSIMSPAVTLRALFIWIVGGFSLLAFVNSYFFRRVFGKYDHKN